jgi:hypothetical protein
VLVDEGLLTFDDVIDAGIGMVGSFNFIKNDNRTIGSLSAGFEAVSSSKLTKEERNIHVLVQRKPDSIVESESQGGVSLFTALAAVEEIGLDVL